MTDPNKYYIYEQVRKSLETLQHHNDDRLNLAYEVGFLRGFITDMIYNDNKIYAELKGRVKMAKEKRK